MGAKIPTPLSLNREFGHYLILACDHCYVNGIFSKEEMSGIEVVALVATVLSAIRILPEIPRIWRRAFRGRENAPRIENGLVVRNRRDVVNPRTGSHTHIGRELEIRRTGDQQMTVSETMTMMRELHNNQTMTQLSANQLHAMNSENAARAYEASLDTVRDIVNLSYQQTQHDRIIYIGCAIIISYLVYLLGISTGENRSLRATLRASPDIRVPVKLSSSRGFDYAGMGTAAKLFDSFVIYNAGVDITSIPRSRSVLGSAFVLATVHQLLPFCWFIWGPKRPRVQGVRLWVDLLIIVAKWIILIILDAPGSLAAMSLPLDLMWLFYPSPPLVQKDSMQCM